MIFTFPKNFLWGTATAAHQVEGNNTNNDFWVMENVEGNIFQEPSGDAIDHYHRYREDISLLASLGFNSYRFSIEWARVEPEDGLFSQVAIDHYRRMLAACRENNMRPVVTLHHFTSPRWLLEMGGWENPLTADRFARYCEKIAEQLGDLIYAACTINEANIGSMMLASGDFPPLDLLRTAPWWLETAKKLNANPEEMLPLFFSSSQKSRQVIMSAHKKGFEALKSGQSSFAVGMTLALSDIQSVEGGEANAAQARYESNTSWLEPLTGDDFIGVQTYSRQRFGPEGPLPAEDGVELTQMGYEFWPEALGATIREAASVTGLPVIVTENGIGTEDDTRRIAYVETALRSVIQCLKDGIDVRGYYYWSGFDNFEWMLGYGPKFGLIEVNRASQRRNPKPSADWLGSIARKNSFLLD